MELVDSPPQDRPPIPPPYHHPPCRCSFLLHPKKASLASSAETGLLDFIMGLSHARGVKGSLREASVIGECINVWRIKTAWCPDRNGTVVNTVDSSSASKLEWIEKVRAKLFQLYLLTIHFVASLTCLPITRTVCLPCLEWGCNLSVSCEIRHWSCLLFSMGVLQITELPS